MALDTYQITLVKGMLKRGDKQHDIAAQFGVNAGRIAEIATGDVGADLPVAYPDELPPAGNPVDGAKTVLLKALRALDAAKRDVEAALRLLP